MCIGIPNIHASLPIAAKNIYPFSHNRADLPKLLFVMLQN
jgi:hypothetical protein